MTIGLLGPVAVVRCSDVGAPPPESEFSVVPGIRAKRLLVALALARGRTRSADRLIADVWGDAPPRSPTSALHTQVSRLRQLLGSHCLEGASSGYRLTGCQTDLDVVAALISDQNDGALESAAAWWRGIPGDDLGEDDADGVRAEVIARADALSAGLDRLRYKSAMLAQDFPKARIIAESRCRRDGLDETAHIDLMRALAGEGRVADAIAGYGSFRRRLSAELGVEPGPEISALHTQLLQKSQLDAKSHPADESHSASTRDSQPGGRWDRSRGLVSETTELFGRDDDLAAIADLLTLRRLVTIQGPGGAGKTRVANRIGHRLAAAGTTVLYVGLAPVRNADDVVPAIAAALGVGEAELGGHLPRLTPGDLQNRLLDAVRGRDALLILDNCEQVVDRCARVVADLLAETDRLRVLTTSRAPLMVAAEQIYPLPMLDSTMTGAATDLFIARARGVRPDAQLPPAQVADLCRRLDGLPLAIELAAARMRTMTLAEICDRLAERFALLRGSDRTVPERHRTLHAVIDWSWELLGRDAREALCRLCSFPGGFTRQGAVAVLGYSGIRLDDTLAALVNQSLLTTTESAGRMRYRMLETVREFGEEKLADDRAELLSVRAAMRQWAVGFAAEATDRYTHGVDAALLEAIAEDVENLVWVLRGCIEELESTRPQPPLDPTDLPVAVHTLISVFPVLAGWWMARGLHPEVVNLGAKILAVLPTPPRGLGDQNTRDWQATLLAIAAHMVIRHNLRSLAIARHHLRRLHRPDRVYSESVDLLTAFALSRTDVNVVRHIVRGVHSDTPEVGTVALAARLNLRENLGDFDGARRDAAALRAIATQTGHVWMSAMVEVALGGLLGQQQNWVDAVPHYRRAVAGLAEIGAYEDEIQTQTMLALCLIGIGDAAGAAVELADLADGWQPDQPDRQGNPELVAGMMIAFAEQAMAAGNSDEAGDLFHRAGKLLISEHPFLAADPDALLLLSVAVVGLMRCGLDAQAREHLPALRNGVISALGLMVWRASPQAGAMALAIGYGLCGADTTREVGVRLLVLSQRLRARRDYPSVAWAVASIQEISGLSEATANKPRVVAMPHLH